MIKIALLSFLSLASAGLIPQHQHGEEVEYGHGHQQQQQHHHYPQATSYQHVKIENYHPVPVYIKKEHTHLLEHPVSKGHTATNVEIHHGEQHHAEHEYQDPGYAVVSGTHQDYHPGLGAYAGHQEEGAEQGDGGHYEAGDYSGHDLQQYAHAGQQEVADYGHQPSSGYAQESNDYEQEEHQQQHLQYHH